MKNASIASVAAGLLSVLLVSAGCNHSNEKEAASSSSATKPSAQSVQSVAPASTTTANELRERMTSTLGDAKCYCMGMIVYAHKHGDMFPTNLSQTLPYLQNHLPSGTNHFEILYHGTANLSGPTVNGIDWYEKGIILRSAPWQTTDGKWVRIYGFLDGHCEAHFEPDDNFSAWEKQHSLRH